MPGADAGRIVVWRTGGALLAASLDATLEVAPVGPDGSAESRVGSLDVHSPPGLPEAEGARWAVVVRAGEGSLALAADEVEGVRAYAAGRVSEVPDWLDGLAAGHVAALVRLDDDRIAALLDLERLSAE